jgi:nucleotide-binding universal stress UspA family protein
MFKSILVPLDGSQLAETVLPAAGALASKLEVPVTLLHVIEKNAPPSVHHERHLTEPAEAEAYLKEVAQQELPTGIHVLTHVHTASVDDVPASLREHINEFQPGLIAMCAHGNGGIRDLLFGSIAQQVLAQELTPLLLWQATIAEKKPFAPKRILVPIDSESAHDDSLPFAQELARVFDAELYLLCVVPNFRNLRGREVAISSMLPSTTQALLDAREQAAGQHLQGHLDELLREGYAAQAEVSRGEPAQTIVGVAERIRADLIILCTHRRAGMQAFWSRSVAPNVARRTRIPLLLIPLEARQA